MPPTVKCTGTQVFVVVYEQVWPPGMRFHRLSSMKLDLKDS